MKNRKYHLSGPTKYPQMSLANIQGTKPINIPLPNASAEIKSLILIEKATVQAKNILKSHLVMRLNWRSQIC